MQHGLAGEVKKRRCCRVALFRCVRIGFSAVRRPRSVPQLLPPVLLGQNSHSPPAVLRFLSPSFAPSALLHVSYSILMTSQWRCFPSLSPNISFLSLYPPV